MRGQAADTQLSAGGGSGKASHGGARETGPPDPEAPPPCVGRAAAGRASLSDPRTLGRLAERNRDSDLLGSMHEVLAVCIVPGGAPASRRGVNGRLQKLAMELGGPHVPSSSFIHFVQQIFTRCLPWARPVLGLEDDGVQLTGQGVTLRLGLGKGDGNGSGKMGGGRKHSRHV